jgi:hypothetical protein
MKPLQIDNDMRRPERVQAVEHRNATTAEDDALSDFVRDTQPVHGFTTLLMIGFACPNILDRASSGVNGCFGSNPDLLLGGRTSASAECRHWWAVRCCAILFFRRTVGLRSTRSSYTTTTIITSTRMIRDQERDCSCNDYSDRARE